MANAAHATVPMWIPRETVFRITASNCEQSRCMADPLATCPFLVSANMNADGEKHACVELFTPANAHAQGQHFGGPGREGVLRASTLKRRARIVKK
jgi:hypothetical protein